MVSISIICQFGATVNGQPLSPHRQKQRRRTKLVKATEAVLGTLANSRQEPFCHTNLFAMSLRSGCESTSTTNCFAGAVRKPVTYKYRDLSLTGRTQLGRNPTTRVRREGCFSCDMQVKEKWVLTCRLTTNRRLHMSCVTKLTGEVGRACKQR